MVIMAVPQSGGGDYTPADAGMHIGICYGLIDLGSHPQDWQGETKMKRQILVQFELPKQTDDEGRPKTISKFYTFGNAENGNLFKDVKCWKGERIDAPGYDLSTLLATPATLNITSEEKDGKKKSKIASINPIMDGIVIPERVNPLLALSLTDEGFSQAIFNAVSDRIKAMIAKSPEFQGLVEKGIATYDGEGGQQEAKSTATSVPSSGGVGPAGMGHATQEIPVNAYGN
jgi:hypothetical protein